jgi:hypothetical protein
MQQFGIVEWIAVASCFLVIYFVLSFYMNLASEVIAELVKIDMPRDSSKSIDEGAYGTENRT